MITTMQHHSPRRRTQFSSCDACRHSRVACDASEHGYELRNTSWRGSCSRCSRRKRQCTFEWINIAKQKPANSHHVRKSQSPTAETAVIDESEHSSCGQAAPQDLGRPPSDIHTLAPILTESLSSYTRTAEAQLMRWAERLFYHGFETIFGLSVGRYGCPLVNDMTSEVCISSSQLFGKLDAHMNVEIHDHSLNTATETSDLEQHRDLQLEKSLLSAIECFAARWLPLVLQRYHLTTIEVECIVRDNWRSARKDMLKVINSLSYRSILTLYLFAQTPIPVGISEDEELDGVSGPVCMQTAFMQLQKLRERQGSCQFKESIIPAWTSASPSSSHCNDSTQLFVDLESRAYWAVVMWDTSSSLTTNCRTSLTSGLKGACSEPAWRLTKSFLAGSFHHETEDWRTNGFEMSDETACKIISAVAICSLYVQKNITSLKEALREGVHEDGVLFAWTEILQTMNIFKTTIRPLLNTSERQLYFLNQGTRLSWYEANLQYYLGILILVDTLEVANRQDLLLEIDPERQDAEHESFNMLKFGIDSTCTIRGPEEDSYTTWEFDCTGRSITTSLIAISPYPQHVIDSVLLMHKVISRKYCRGEIKHEVYSYLALTLSDALKQLPQTSKPVQVARDKLQGSLQSFNDTTAIHTTEGK